MLHLLVDSALDIRSFSQEKIKIFCFSNKKRVPLQSDYYPNLRKFEWQSLFLWPGMYVLLLFKCLIIKTINGGYFKL